MFKFKYLAIISNLIAPIFCYSMELPEGSGETINIINNSKWSIKLSYRMKDGFKTELVLYHNGGVATIEDANNLILLNFKSYGQYAGVLAVEHNLLMEKDTAQYRSHKESNVFITTNWLEQWNVEIKPGPLPEQYKIQKFSGNPFFVFHAAKERINAGKKVHPRHILGVPEDTTEDNWKAAYKRLKGKFQVKNFPNEAKRFIERVNSILDEAREKADYSINTYVFDTNIAMA